MNEESISFETGNLFYNPNMQFCRSFFSLAVGALGGKLHLLDGFAASGIRGIRYAKENRNVQRVDFLDANDEAIPVLKKNLKNSMKDSKVRGNVLHFLYEKHFVQGFSSYDLIEIDPFGTPAPYLWSTFYGQQRKERFYLSVTATDTAVLCGPEAKACLKNYHAKSLNNEFTHENGTRILLKRIAEAAMEFNFGIVPQVSLSDRHYLKVLVKCERGAGKADESAMGFGYVSYCPICGWRKAGKRMENACGECNHNGMPDYAGPLWLGELHNRKTVQQMRMLNTKRRYAHAEEIEKKLALLEKEIDMPPFYYDMHILAKKWGRESVPKIGEVLKQLQKYGFRADRTHFASTAIKTDAPIAEVKKAMKYRLPPGDSSTVSTIAF